MEGDVPEETVMLRSDLGVVLSGLPLFTALAGAILSEIAAAWELSPRTAATGGASWAGSQPEIPWGRWG